MQAFLKNSAPRFAALVLAFLIFGGIGFSKAVTDDAGNYTPRRFGLPDTIGGYAVLAVLTEDNFVCMAPGKKRLILQSMQPTIDGALRDIPQELAHWDSGIVGPKLTREQLVSQIERSYLYFKVHGCASLQLPSADGCSQQTGECKHSPPYPGYAIIQNTSIHNYSDKCPDGIQVSCPVLAQSVILVAPIVGSAQGGISSDRIAEDINIALKAQLPYAKCSGIPTTCNHHPGWSALLNNGITDKKYFLQVGVLFTNQATIAPDGTVNPQDLACNGPVACYGEGYVVWARAAGPGHAFFSPSANAQFTAVPYIAGHEYYTVVSYSSNIWWTCAADTADLATYQCQNHPDAVGDHLIEDKAGTNVFVEVWNEDRNWAGLGFTIQWPAHDAFVYVNGMPPQPWSSQAVWALDACPDAWPATNVVTGSLVPQKDMQFNNGWAFFNAAGDIPPFCF